MKVKIDRDTLVENRGEIRKSRKLGNYKLSEQQSTQISNILLDSLKVKDERAK